MSACAFWCLTSLLPLYDPALPGPYHVGARTIEVVDRQRDNRVLMTEVWYPTHQTPDSSWRFSSGVPSCSCRDGAPARGAFPCVVFSHGLTSVREQSAFLTEHLASHGYVVVSTDHNDRLAESWNPADLYQAGMDRPMDVRVVLDVILARSRRPGDWLYGLVDRNRIAVVGHSLGAYTALAVGGALVDGSEHPKTGAADWPDYFEFADPRIDAIVALTPFYRPAFDAFGVSQLRKPLLIVGVSEDPIVTPFAANQVPLFEQTRGPAYLMYIKGAAHLSFVEEALIQKMPFFVRWSHRPTLPADAAIPIIRRLAVAFLDRHLTGADRYAAILETDAANLDIRSKGVPRPLAAGCPPP